MSGTIVISKEESFDVRNVDFVRIVNALRSKIAESPIAGRLLETVDEFGINMICADDFDSIEFKDFAALMRMIGSAFSDEDKELLAFIDDVYVCINRDERLLN